MRPIKRLWQKVADGGFKNTGSNTEYGLMASLIGFSSNIRVEMKLIS